MVSSLAPYKTFKSIDPLDSFDSLSNPRDKIKGIMNSKSLITFQQKRTCDVFKTGQQKLIPVYNIAKKYFGKKVTYVSQIDAVVHCIKYLKEIIFTDKPQIIQTRYAFARTKQITTTTAIKSLGGVVIIDEQANTSDKDILRLMSACYYQTVIKLDNCINIERLNSLPARAKYLVRHLHIEFPDNEDLHQLENIFEGFNSLISLHYELSGLILSLEFFQNVLQLKTLEALTLDLTQIEMPRSELVELVHQLEERGISKWHIKTSWCIDDEVEEINPVLGKIDCFALSMITCGGYKFDTFPYHLTPEFSKRKDLIDKSRRILEITYRGRDILRLTGFLNPCISLQSLYLNIRGHIVKPTYGYGFEEDAESQEEEEIEGCQETRSWATNLKDVVISIASSSKVMPTFEALVSKIREESQYLENLELFHHKSDINQYFEETSHRYGHIQNNDDRITYEKSDKIVLNPQGFAKFLLVQDLRIAVENLALLYPVLSQLPNLKKLQLIVTRLQESGYWDDQFPLKYLGGVKELRIRVDSQWKVNNWGEGLLHNLNYLEGLDVLEITSSPNQRMSLKMFCLLVAGLTSLINLRRVRLRVKVLNALAYSEMPEKMERYLRMGEEEVFRELKQQIMSFIGANRNLQEMYFGELVGYAFQSIKYERC